MDVVVRIALLSLTSGAVAFFVFMMVQLWRDQRPYREERRIRRALYQKEKQIKIRDGWYENLYKERRSSERGKGN